MGWADGLGGGPAIAAAFGRVPRERFLPPPPWLIAQPFDTEHPYRETTDPAEIHADVVVAIDPKRQLNNGQPSAHAMWMQAADPKPGDAVLHVGCGTGYYTAILAELVSPDGRVVAREIDSDLAARAAQNLAGWPQVSVGRGDGPFEVIYVNAGATHALSEWLDAVKPGGRLLLPLTVHLPMFPQHGVGFVLLAERRPGPWAARVVSPVGIFDCVGARDSDCEAQLKPLIREPERIHSVVLTPHTHGSGCLMHHDGFCLQ
jgi:protein-L-isoaspartate(D-aspartate) O-methyltransferase